MHHLNQCGSERSIVLQRHVTYARLGSLRILRKNRKTKVTWLRIWGPFLAKEWGLKCKTIHDTELLKNCDPGRGLFTLFNSKPTILKRKQMVLLTANQWYDSQLRISDPTLLLIVLKGAPIEEGIVLSRVTMQISEQRHFPFTVHMPYNIFSMINRQVK